MKKEYEKPNVDVLVINNEVKTEQDSSDIDVGGWWL